MKLSVNWCTLFTKEDWDKLEKSCVELFDKMGHKTPLYVVYENYEEEIKIMEFANDVDVDCYGQASQVLSQWVNLDFKRSLPTEATLVEKYKNLSEDLPF